MSPIQPYAVSPDRLPAYVEGLAAMLEGGPALLPYPADEPAPHLPHQPELPNDLGLVMSTSGSTGEPKRAMLTRVNVRASAAATHARLGGPGTWLLALPAHHIAGTQVIVRSLVERRAPLLLNVTDGFDPQDVADAVAWMAPGRRYTSLVPTQLSRILDHEAATAALASFAAVLLGGAATAPGLLQRARDAGIAVRTTYGSSETAGGCVYDGQPLDGTSITLDDNGRVALAGPTIAAGYLADPDRTAATFDIDPDTNLRRFWTDDVGEWRDDRLRILGRRDDLITTGGMKVAPRIVEEAALDLTDVRDAVAVATAHDRWGQAVSLVIVSPRTWSLEELRDALRDRLPSYALPTRLLQLPQIPTRGPGKPDRARLAQLTGWQNQA